MNLQQRKRIKDEVWQYASENDFMGEYSEVDRMLNLAIVKTEKELKKH